ncbi:NAD(P)-dependent dehydrogenase (short-subunit alcohol dehydrogenase family) [Allocatelliglobosispora scoriae]|uniref:NAD(P)-dependent dehydrogenase (Short-subunit alcohol dehydrogenase family) n=1 Tax=Allocatelliglobosispora scoriae TaxID=643052 RepID=A0A841BZJ8_9ACTN|nr:SDR family oxidoreductase [Allocatelliglobosispora scoriae]MBB5873016.1 NAD(P)-dependent dehydrogenase (short-subunit alcohol dehydrogenase family) [Allocatelliglobosispora scoriae]
MLLERKVAVVYGAGSIGTAVASAFAREGARVFLASRKEETLRRSADRISAAGGTAETAVVDALDQQAVTDFVDGVARRAGAVDISCNVIGVGDVQQPLLEISVGDFLQPIRTAMRSQFITTRAAAPHMISQGGGVVITFGGSGPQTIAGLGGFKVSLDAMEGLRRQWAIELGPHGIRVVTLKSGGIAESLPPEMPEAAAITEALTKDTQLGRTATLADVGNVAAFVASDHARTITSTEVNISCGAIVD